MSGVEQSSKADFHLIAALPLAGIEAAGGAPRGATAVA
jgi:hypothetical protein